MSTTDTRKPVASAAAWKKAAGHVVTCPSGAEISVKIPDLAGMIVNGVVPQNLLDVAVGVANDAEETKPSVELVKQQQEFTNLLVLHTVVEPKLAESDLPDLPFEDKEFIVSLATRQRDLDALGEHIGGLTKSEKFRRFRRLGEFDSDVAGL